MELAVLRSLRVALDELEPGTSRSWLILTIRKLNRIMNQVNELGNSGLAITRLGVGAWAMGGSGWAFAWGDQDDRDSIAAIHAAVDAGMNWIDTAAIYGLGHSEEV